MNFKNLISVVLFIYIVLSIFNIETVSSDCKGYKCIELGEICDSGETCPSGSFCNLLYDIPICEISRPSGEACDRDDVCQRGLSCVIDNTDRYCSDSQYKGFGENCLDPIECSSGLDCLANGTNICYRDLANCVKDSCPAGKFCNSATKICTTLKSVGKECDLDYECEPGSKCVITPNVANRTCVAMNSKQAGEPCVNGDDSCDIGLNLVCINGFCKKYEADGDSEKPCTSNSTCPLEVEQCICSSWGKQDGTCKQVKGEGIDCKKAKSAYYTCLKESECPLYVDNADSPNSCQSKKCYKTKCAYEEKCILTDYNCNHTPLSYCPESLSSTLLISNLYLLILIVIFTFF